MRRGLVALCMTFPAWTDAALAARLPIQQYTTADGLAHDRVSHVLQDSRGFLWFATGEGLSRFDGYRFSTVGADDGIPRARVTALVELDGDYWVATLDGICVFSSRTSAHCEPRPIGREVADR